MPNINRITNSLLPDRLYGEHYPDSFLDMPGPLRSTNMGSLDNFAEQLRKVSDKSDKPDISGESSQSGQPNIYRDCSGALHAKCDSASSNAYAITGRSAGGSVSATGNEGRVSPNQFGNIRCPENGKLCHTSVCRDECGDWVKDRNKARQERRERNK